MAFVPGDRVHLSGIGTGIVREARSSGRYVVIIKGRTVVAAERDLESANASAKPRHRGSNQQPQAAMDDTLSDASLDLHGKTTDEAVAAVEGFINDALLAGHARVRVIHGRSGGRVKAALYQYLRKLPSVSFRLDSNNPGVTIVTFP